jgi:hypothetical protein
MQTVTRLGEKFAQSGHPVTIQREGTLNKCPGIFRTQRSRRKKKNISAATRIDPGANHTKTGGSIYIYLFLYLLVLIDP